MRTGAGCGAVVQAAGPGASALISPRGGGGQGSWGCRPLPLQRARRRDLCGPGRARWVPDALAATACRGDDAPRLARPRAPARGCIPASASARAGSARAQTGTPDPGGEEWGGAQPGAQPQAAKVSLNLTQSNLETKQSSAPDSESSRNHSQLFAAAVGNVEWLRFCLDQDQGEIRRDGKGFAAIHFAAQRGKLACMKILIEEYKVPVDLPTNSSQTPLHLVIRKDNNTVAVPCIQYLLKKGASINSPTGNGFTALHLAAREGLLGCMKILVQSGANVHAQDSKGCKPIDYCKIWNHRACARFLKDAMWKRDKKNFACEMRKLKRIKDQLTVIKRNYLLQHQKEHQLLIEADFRKWLHRKLLQSQVSKAKQEAGAPACPRALSETPECQIPRNFYRFVEAHLQSMPQPKLPPKPIYRQPKISRPKLWNLSNNLARSRPPIISCPQDIRKGIHPDPCQEHDLYSFLEVTQDPHGSAQLRTVDGHMVAPVPQLPFEVIVQTLYPWMQSYRMKVPEGFYVKSILDVTQRRHLGQDTFWTDTMAMNLRETFDDAFLAAMRAHQGLSALLSSPAPQ